MLQSLAHSSFSLPSLSTHTPPTEIYPLSLHDALPICGATSATGIGPAGCAWAAARAASAANSMLASCRHCSPDGEPAIDRKSTRLNSSHVSISYAVFCLKKKKKKKIVIILTLQHN